MNGCSFWVPGNEVIVDPSTIGGEPELSCCIKLGHSNTNWQIIVSISVKFSIYTEIKCRTKTMGVIKPIEWMCELQTPGKFEQSYSKMNSHKDKTILPDCGGGLKTAVHPKNGSCTAFSVCTRRQKVTHLNKDVRKYLPKSPIWNVSEPFPERKLEIIQCTSTRLVPEYC